MLSPFASLHNDFSIFVLFGYILFTFKRMLNHQSRRYEDDGLRHRRRDHRASQQTCEAGVGDTGEDGSDPCGQTCAACAGGAAQARAAAALAVRPVAEQSTRQHTHARSAARGARQSAAERRPARAGADGPAQGREQGRAPRWPTRPLVKASQDSAQHEKKFVRSKKFSQKEKT